MDIVIEILQFLGIIIGSLILLWIFEMFIVAFIPGISVPKQNLDKTLQPSIESDTNQINFRKDVSFEIKGIPLSAWLYLPEDLSSPVPCIIMTNGLGGTKDIILEDYALRFQEAGFAILSFDYRYFGESGGEPRQLVWIPYQLQDYAAAIEYVRTLDEIDPSRIALWGTSLSGGHVIVTAARENSITCVVAQCPWLDGFAASKAGYKIQGLKNGLRLFMHGQRDFVRSWFGLSPHKIPIAGKPGTVAVLAFSEAFEAFNIFATDSFINEVCARILIRLDKYRPIKKAKKVSCPVLLQICDKDEPVPVSSIEDAAKDMGIYSEVKHYPIGHFDIYFGSNFEISVNDQLDFLKKHLLAIYN